MFNFNKTNVCLLLCLLNFFIVFGQNKQKLLNEANDYFKKREYTLALDTYKEARQKDTTDLFVVLQIGICYLKSIHKSEAQQYFVYLERKKPDFTPLLDFYLAEAYRYNNFSDESLRRYAIARQRFEKENPEKKILLVNDELTVKELLIFIDQRLQELKTGTHFMADPTTTKVRNIGNLINSEYSDYAPVISADESVLIFTSRRKGSTGGLIDAQDGLHYEDIYVSQKNKKGEWEKPKNIGKDINSRYHEACIALSPDGKKLFIYQDDNGGDIYFAELTGKREWSEPAKMNGDINSKFQEPSLSITNDGNTIYFSSDRLGGYGGLDIYRCDKDAKGNWGKVVNLGPTINTKEDDDAPFIHFDSKTLYFSSKGHLSLGGFDIYYSEYINEQWTKPVNLGYPINTSDDDIHFVLASNYKRGYYATKQKEGYGDKDIYIIDMPEYKDVEEINFPLTIKTVSVGFKPLITNDTERALVTIRGVIKDEDTDQLINAKMTLIDVIDNEIVDDIGAASPKGVYHTIMQTGRKYLLHVQKEGYLFHAEYFEIPVGVIDQEKVLNIYLKRIKEDKTIDFKALFDYNSAELKKLSYAALDNLFAFLSENTQIRGEIGGHTDNIGSDRRNLELSSQRAKSVYDYLVRKGIDKDRLLYRGYGSSIPIATNDSVFGRSMNRRTEFKVLRVIQQ